MQRLEIIAVAVLLVFASAFLSGFWSATRPTCSQLFTDMLMLHLATIGSAMAAVALRSTMSRVATYALIFLLLIYGLIVDSALYGGGRLAASFSAC